MFHFKKEQELTVFDFYKILISGKLTNCHTIIDNTCYKCYEFLPTIDVITTQYISTINKDVIIDGIVVKQEEPTMYTSETKNVSIDKVLEELKPFIRKDKLDIILKKK